MSLNAYYQMPDYKREWIFYFQSFTLSGFSNTISHNGQSWPLTNMLTGGKSDPGRPVNVLPSRIFKADFSQNDFGIITWNLSILSNYSCKIYLFITSCLEIKRGAFRKINDFQLKKNINSPKLLNTEECLQHR